MDRRLFILSASGSLLTGFGGLMGFRFLQDDEPAFSKPSVPPLERSAKLSSEERLQLLVLYLAELHRDLRIVDSIIEDLSDLKYSDKQVRETLAASYIRHEYKIKKFSKLVEKADFSKASDLEKSLFSYLDSVESLQSLRLSSLRDEREIKDLRRYPRIRRENEKKRARVLDEYAALPKGRPFFRVVTNSPGTVMSAFGDILRPLHFLVWLKPVEQDVNILWIQIFNDGEVGGWSLEKVRGSTKSPAPQELPFLWDWIRMADTDLDGEEEVITWKMGTLSVFRKRRGLYEEIASFGSPFLEREVYIDKIIPKRGEGEVTFHRANLKSGNDVEGYLKLGKDVEVSYDGKIERLREDELFVAPEWAYLAQVTSEASKKEINSLLGI